MAVTQLVGAKIHRREDPRLITGHGHYVDDFTRAGTAYASFVRSPFAHAGVKSIDITEASKAPGVVGIYTARDFKGQLAGTHPAAPAFVAEKKYIPERFPIAEKEVTYQGEIVAAVLAETKAQAADAANMIQVDYAELPAVMDLEKALDAKSPKAHEGAADNICWDLTYVGPDATEAAFKDADVVVKQRILQNRLAPTPMEPRGVMAEYESFDKKLTITMSSQNPHFIRLFVSGSMGLKESQVRVISPDVGGGFGSKISPYPEDYLVPALSRMTERPVKWIETRTESIQNATHGRGQFYDVEVAAKKDGTLLAMRMTQYLDVGAYVGTFSAFQACACLMAGGAYKWPGGISARTIGILTNRVPTDPYRGAGRPEATHLVERMVDLVADELKMDAVEIRRKNFIQPDQFPFTQHFGLVIDSGDYEKSLNRALEMAGYDQLLKQQAEGRKHGKHIGIGLSTWIELCGFGPSAATAPATGGIALVESAQVRVMPTGSVTVYTGTHAHGQGHETTFSQIVADQLGVPLDNVELRHGDTAEGPAFGYGTYGSRSLSVGGVAVSKAVGKVIDKGRKLAAHLLEAAEEDVVFEHGNFHVKGSPDKAKAFGEIAFASYGMNLPQGMEQGLEAVAYFDPPNLVWPFGAHVAVVEVDPETGSVQLQKYVAVDDCGNIINPMIVDGQIHGGVAQAIAQALFEEVVYDEESGQLKTGTLLDYNIPGIGEIPPLELDHTVTPSPTNDLGVKGIGEAGTIAASAAVINAICDALTPVGIKHVDMPASPDRLWKQIQEARK
ncbi:MAG TPA: molybdopterin cofactor-binding domain-containing protein [Candidatus Dormibacteraeota bacterium]|nr:molybdopterin cofactor-binding domain-containing protein [Candidatus Dormibacteraeota bacterium]